MRARPKVLVIAPIRPARSGNGLAMRVCLFVEAAEAFADVDVVVVPVAGEPPASSPAFRATTRLHEVPARPCTALALIARIPAGARAEAFRAYGRPSLSGYLSAEAHACVARLVAGTSYDLVVVLRGYMMPLAEHLDGKTVLGLDLDEDDYASAISQASVAAARNDPARAAWLQAEAVAADRMIASNATRVSGAFVSCAEDARALGRRHADLYPGVIHNAVAMPRAPPRRHDGRTILFVGAFGHLANLEGIEWFIRTVAPRLKARDPRGFNLVVAGARPPRGLLRLGTSPRIEIAGWFDDPAALYARATIAIAPMRFGGGARTKIIEAAAHAVATVAHAASANATLAGAGWVADNAGDFAALCAEALSHPEERRAREDHGRRVAARLYDRSRVIAGLSRQLAKLAGL